MKTCSKIFRISLFSILSTYMLLWNQCLLADENSGEVIEILALGDSITQAESNRASFRYPLWKKLIDAGINFDFVGSMQNQFSQYNKGIPPHHDYKGQKFDPDHEGHFAWSADEIIRGRNYDNGSGSGRLQDWLKEYDVDIALIHLGTNDAFMRQDNQTTSKELESIVSLLREDNPKVIILLARLIPTMRTPGDTQSVVSLNEAIVELSKTLGTAESPVILVDQFEGFNGETDLYDKVHPNARGEEKMAEKWFNAIQHALTK
jgi:lysophospholipase L1-like esterase